MDTDGEGGRSPRGEGEAHEGHDLEPGSGALEPLGRSQHSGVAAIPEIKVVKDHEAARGEQGEGAAHIEKGRDLGMTAVDPDHVVGLTRQAEESSRAHASKDNPVLKA